jgi:ABC-type transporter Mla MlaB component
MESHITERCVTLQLAGALTSDYVPETRSKLEDIQQQGYGVVLELSELRHIDREGIALLTWAGRAGAQLVNGQPYVLTWIGQEALQSKGTL